MCSFKLNNLNDSAIDYESFEWVYVKVLKIHAPFKETS